MAALAPMASMTATPLNARALGSKASTAQRVPSAGRRVQTRKVAMGVSASNNIMGAGNIREQAGRRGACRARDRLECKLTLSCPRHQPPLMLA